MKQYACIVDDMRDTTLRCYRVELNTEEEAVIHFSRIFGDRLELIYRQDANHRTVIYERK